MINPVNIRGVIIGEGKPKVIVPIVEKTHDGILCKAEELKALKLDIIEWRADFYEAAPDTAQIAGTLSALKGITGEIPLLFTFRTKNEGGEKYITPTEYTALNLAAAEAGADIIDIEIFGDISSACENIRLIKNCGKAVIASNHDFNKTPPVEELVDRLIEMQKTGADILKIAVMPQSTEDVLALLTATHIMHTKHAKKPVITMAMSDMGIISRFSGGVFGSAAAFGAAGKASAPGQTSVEDLNHVLGIIHKAD